MSTMVGEIKLWATDNIPAGWLICDGSQLSIAQYGALYAVLGSTYGSSGAYFNLPDLRQRTVRGVDSVNELIGSTTGNNFVTINSDNLPVHQHTASFTNTTTAHGTTSVAIPVDANEQHSNVPSTDTILSKAVIGSNAVKIYSTNSHTTTLRPFDSSVTLPTITGTVAVEASGNSEPIPLNITPPTMLLHYIIAAVGVLPSY